MRGLNQKREAQDNKTQAPLERFLKKRKLELEA